MLKMLIADDEPVIIRGLQMLIDWALRSAQPAKTAPMPCGRFLRKARIWPCWTSRCPARPALKF